LISYRGGKRAATSGGSAGEHKEPLSSLKDLGIPREKKNNYQKWKKAKTKGRGDLKGDAGGFPSQRGSLLSTKKKKTGGRGEERAHLSGNKTKVHKQAKRGRRERGEIKFNYCVEVRGAREPVGNIKREGVGWKRKLEEQVPRSSQLRRKRGRRTGEGPFLLPSIPSNKNSLWEHQKG